MSRLVKAKSGFSSSQFVVEGVAYTQTTLVDSAFPGMEPIICFKANLVSSAPSAAPTGISLMTQVQVNQAITGVSYTVANSALGRAALTYAIQTSSGAASPNDITIIGISPTTRRRVLLVSGINIVYDVLVKVTPPATAISTTTLQVSNSCQ